MHKRGTKEDPDYSGGPTIFELHKIMKYLGCADALSLDGGGSTQAKWKEPSGTNASYDGQPRSVYCQLALTTAAANGCNWNATS
ncbi:MAG: phosphodiester glycosidase family protein [Treponema sp.]|nr:phosphodiester glycosidase family protein [Treponema sp.]